MVLGEQIGKRFVGQLLKATPALLAHQVDRCPSLGIKFDAFADHQSMPSRVSTRSTWRVAASIASSRGAQFHDQTARIIQGPQYTAVAQRDRKVER
jgi:hypothetical protein